MNEDRDIIQAVCVLREELMKHGDLYNGFLASINSVIREGISEDISERILARIIGED